MSIYRPKPATDIPIVYLSEWRAYRIKSKHPQLKDTTHLVGRNIDDEDGRVSSPVKSWKPSKMQAITRSGRIYQLVGKPGGCLDGQYVWGTWCKLNSVTDIKDETEKFTGKRGAASWKTARKRK